MSRCKLEEFISYEQPAKYIVDSDQYDDSYETPVLTAGKSFILGYTDETNNIFDNLPVIIFDDFTTSVQFVDFPFKVKSSAMKLLKNTEQADIKYCYYLLKFLQHTPENHKRQWLSATSQNIVELPTIEEQKNIVKKLDTILEVIDNQNKQLELLDEAIKARFVEMFGDPNYNPKGYKKDIIKDHIDLLSGYPFKSENYVDSGINICGGLVIMPQKIKWEECIHWKSAIGYENYLLNNNDIVMALDRPWISEGFKVAKVDSKHLPALLIQRTVRIRAIDMNQDYLYYCFICGGFNKHCNVTGSLVPHISSKDIKSFEVMLPPLELQNQFASFVEEIDKSRSRIQKSLEASQELFDSLMQEYFG